MTEKTSEERTEELETEETEDEATIDVETTEEETGEQDLRELVEEQQEEIEELQDIVLDLSARAAHSGGIGVCPDCHGPLRKVGGGFLGLKTKIKCGECGEVYHEY